MKREGRQHGMVQTYPIIQSPWNSKRTNKFESTAGLFTRVSQKPTNRSKFTGKCARPRCASCHIQPAGKCKDKAKGTQKLKSCDVVTNYRLLSWRVVDSRRGLNFKGFSATGILEHLANDYADDEDQNDDTSYDDADGVYQYGGSGSCSYGCGLPPNHHHDWEATSVAIQELDEVDGDYKRADCDGDGDGDADGSGDDDERMSFCDVGFTWEQVEALEGDVDGWCLVEEI